MRSCDDPVAAAVAVGIGILIGAGAVWLLSSLTTGDEPPIRVRNGSIQLEVLHSTRHWQQTGNVWKISQGTRLVDSYWLYFAPTNPAECKAVKANGNKIRFIMDDGTEVVVESKNKKTEVSSTIPLTLSADEKTLSYGTAATFIKEIRFDGAGDYLCQFAVKDVNLHSLLTE
jgi:hypothetical protein